MYQPYRGQRDRRQKLVRNIVIAVLVLFSAACSVFLLFFQGTFQQWKANYIKTHPIQEQAAAQAQTNTQQPVKDTQKAETSAQQTTKTADTAVSKTLELTRRKLGDAAYLQQVVSMYQQGQINAAAIMVKDAEGQLSYPSGIAELKGTAALANADASVLSAVKTLKAAGIHMTAILYTYQDNLYPRQNSGALLRNKSGKAWLHSTKRCMDPGSDAAFAYIQKLVQECGTLGFDEVVLKGFGWPQTGSLQKIDYGTNTDAAARAAVLAKQVSTLTSAVPSVQVSVWLEEPLAANGQSVTGQNLSSLYPVAAHIYVPLESQTATSGSEIRTKLASQTGGQTTKLVPVFTSTSLAPTLLGGKESLYFDTSETKGLIDNYAKTTK